MSGLVRRTQSIRAQNFASVTGPQHQERASVHARRSVLAALVIASGVSLVENVSAAAPADGPTGIQVTMAPKGAAEYMKRRDDAMEYKCKGGMMDCDGDRRDFAKKQWEEFVERGGKKKGDGPKSF